MYRTTLSQQMHDLLTPFFQEQGYELIELQLQQRKGRWLVRLFADTEGGISLEDCRKLSVDIGQLLEAADIIDAAYVLEVSSPGLDRPLKTRRDFQRQLQRMVTIFLSSPFEDQVQYTGRLIAAAETYIILHLPPETPLTIPLSLIKHGIIELEFK